MEQVAKQFTIIDFLGILIPGAIVALAVNTCLLDLTLPAKDFFGDNTWLLFVYFVILSYLCGHALNQLAIPLEQKIWKVPNMHANFYERQEVQKAYCTVFQIDVFPDSEIERIKAGQNIFHYVQKGNRPQRILIFTAFYTMSRALVIAFFIMLAISLPYAWGQMKVWSILMIFILCVALIVIFRFRWIYYEQKCIDEAYMLFLTDQNNKNESQIIK